MAMVNLMQEAKAMEEEEMKEKLRQKESVYHAERVDYRMKQIEEKIAQQRLKDELVVR